VLHCAIDACQETLLEASVDDVVFQDEPFELYGNDLVVQLANNRCQSEGAEVGKWLSPFLKTNLFLPPTISQGLSVYTAGSANRVARK